MQENDEPDFTQGFSIPELFDRQAVPGKVGDADVLLIRDGSDIFAISAGCTHYHAALKDGLIVGDTVRCPLHHACFSLRSGEALRAPALDPLDCWRTEQIGGVVYVREKLPRVQKKNSSARNPAAIVIVGGGAAGLGAAEMLRREGYRGSLTMISADDTAPYDRPNLSKDFLAGTAPPEWIPLREPDYYHSLDINLVLRARVTSIDKENKKVVLHDGTTYAYEALLLATGAEPIRLELSGADSSRVLYLRSFEDSKKIVEKIASAKRVVVIGSSFIGLEAASSLQGQGIEVHVVSKDEQPLARILGKEVGTFLRQLHESHGVRFYLGATVSHAAGSAVVLDNGTTIEDADFILVGIGVTPSLELATHAGLEMDRGVLVNEYLETSYPGIYAAGDIARWPDPASGERIRVEHWVVAERQGQVAAKNMLGKKESFQAVPFFWTQQYDVTINYVGYATRWDTLAIDGKLEERNCRIDYILDGKNVATATIGRDLSSLETELRMERAIALR